MVKRGIAAYLDFVNTPAGTALVVVVSLAICAAILLWAWHGSRWSRWQRIPAVLAAVVLTLIMATIYAVALAQGWWGGLYFRTPLVVQAAMLVPLSLVGWVAWLLGYGWLSEHSRFPLLVYAAGALLLIPAAVLADRTESSRGLLMIAADGEVWVEALLGALALLAPVFIFEGVRRGLSRDLLP
jgi:hypothetical protein